MQCRSMLVATGSDIHVTERALQKKGSANVITIFRSLIWWLRGGRMRAAKGPGFSDFLHFMNPNRPLAVAERCLENVDSKRSVWVVRFAGNRARQTGYAVRFAVGPEWTQTTPDRLRHEEIWQSELVFPKATGENRASYHTGFLTLPISSKGAHIEYEALCGPCGNCRLHSSCAFINSLGR